MRTNEFNAVIGVISGYQGEECLKQFSQMKGNELAIAWQEEALKEMNYSGIYVSTIINESKSLYNTEWGCPIGGEPTYTLEGSRNPQFCKDEEEWKDAVRRVVKAVKGRFNQTTVTLNFREIEQEYIID